MTRPSRRRFLQSAAFGAAGVGVAAAAAAAFAGDGGSYDLQGIDVSHYQGAVNWAAVRAGGRRYAFCKATEGTTYTDPTFAANWPAMRAAGLLRGAYHFGRPGTSAAAQADYFCDAVRPAPGDLKPVLDLEATDGMTPAQVRAWVVAFVSRVVARTGQTPVIYTGYYFWRDSAGNGSNLNCPLWLAQYASAVTLVPAAWATWTFWQYTSTGTCPGVAGGVDLDAFNGNKTGLNNLRLP